MTSRASYPLSPMQQGVLFHSLLAPVSGMYVHHVVCVLHEAVVASALHRAWKQVVARHPILRTSLHWQGLDEPYHAVQEEAVVPFQEEDWRGLSARERSDRLEAYLHADRERGFDLEQAPLLLEVMWMPLRLSSSASDTPHLDQTESTPLLGDGLALEPRHAAADRGAAPLSP